MSCGGSGDPVDSGTGLNEKSCTLQYTLPQAGTATGTDPLLANQWHLQNTGQFGGKPGEDLRAIAAWALNRGDGARVAVVDDAIEVTHLDLLPNVVAGASFNYRAARFGTAYPLPCFTGDDHGTAVAGLVAARADNNLGGAGVAPDVQLVGYNPLSTNVDADIADALTRDLQANDVFHNSWGAPDSGPLYPAEALFVNAINTGLASGRGGKGSVYVFPAGNGGCYARAADGSCYRESSNFDGYVNKLGIITACAVDNQGRAPYYVERGANVMICGMSSGSSIGITTTDIENRFRNNFSGTSASAPMVSGVAALILAENPSLTWRDVQQVMLRSARKNDPADAEWRSEFGLDFNPKYGFGVADAQAAVTLARSWTSIGGSESLVSCGPFTRAPNLDLPDPPLLANNTSGTPVTVTDTNPVAGCPINKIEFIEIRLTADHSYSGDLRVDLVSPNGLVSELAYERVCPDSGGGDPCGSYTDWPFGSVRHMDEPVDGDWQLRVTDVQARDSGRFNTWSLRFFGRP
ncbi:MAG: S8 family peptidase [Burkholderiaceae bacterium]